MRFSSTIVGFLAASSAVSALPRDPYVELEARASPFDAVANKLKSLLNVVSDNSRSIESRLKHLGDKSSPRIKQRVGEDLEAIHTATVSVAPAITKDLDQAPKVVGERAANHLKESVAMIGNMVKNMEDIAGRLVDSELKGASDLLSGNIKLKDAAMAVVKPVEEFVDEVSAAPGSAAGELVEAARKGVKEAMKDIQRLQAGV